MRLFKYRELLLCWTWREIAVRYKQSVLGLGWAVLQPLSLTAVFAVVFTLFARVPADDIPYPLFAYCGLLPWTFFSNALVFAVPSLVNNMNLVTKVYFPREILPAAAVLACLVDFAAASAVFAALAVYYGVSVSLTCLAIVPAVLCVQLALTMGVAVFASAVNVFYRDARFVVPLAVQLWMFASPVIYPVSAVPDKWRFAYMLNPMAPIIDSYRSLILLSRAPQWGYLGLAALVSAAALAAAYGWFRKVEMEFADVI